MDHRVLLGICIAVVAVAYLIHAVHEYRSRRAKPGLTEYRLACGLSAAGMAINNLLPARVADEPTTLWTLAALIIVVFLLLFRAGYLAWKGPRDTAH